MAYLVISGMSSILDIGPTIFGGADKIIQFLRAKHCLASSQTCARYSTAQRIIGEYNKINYTCRCLVPMEERPRRDVSDGVSWWCRTCKTRCTIRKDSFFEKSRLSLQKWMIAMYWWARQYPVKDMAQEAQIELGTAIDIYQWLREVCSVFLACAHDAHDTRNLIALLHKSLPPSHQVGRARSYRSNR